MVQIARLLSQARLTALHVENLFSELKPVQEVDLSKVIFEKSSTNAGNQNWQ